MKVRFGDVTLDTRSRRLMRHGDELRLSPKAFDLLAQLLEQRPAVVDKASLRKQLWPDVHVVDASLSNLVTEIRRVLADRSLDRPLIRTVHGTGYAFAGVVEDMDAAGAADVPRTARAWIVWLERPLALSPGDNLVGRDASCQIWIDAEGVSRRHAIVRVSASGAEEVVTIEDLGSTNGTYLNGRRVTASRGLAHGDRLRLGQTSVTFRAGAATDGPTKRVRRRSSS